MNVSKVKSVDCPHCHSKESFIYTLKTGQFFICFDCQRHLPSSKVKISERRVTNSKINFNSILNLCVNVTELPREHFCYNYVCDRKIPEKKLGKLFYTDKFSEIAKTVGKDVKNSPRLVLPFFNEGGHLFALQGRALDDDKVRYITIVFDKNEELIYGKDDLKDDSEFTVVEGPIDSLFLENCVATAGIGEISDKYIPSAVICLDNEPRNKDIVRAMKKNIDRGFKTVIWPNSIKEKDINEMVKNGVDVKSVIKENTFKGLQAILKLNSWKKI